ncbi:MAG: dUTPase [Puniceicoccales bacterium]|jgi:dimeric dUTPase (all-alpha-NTP-PPase superfamily)|nr:dUTPase [Puniceicoccales bacterium]
MDKLDRIFEMQAKLSARLGVNLKNLGEGEKIEWILKYSRALQQEISELIDSVPWKWWAKYQNFDEQNARVEVIDILHFLVSIAQILGMTPEDLFEAYQKKNDINHKRQDSGYAVKDKSDSREI